MTPTLPRTADRWLIHWPQIEPTVAKYQQPVCLARVLSEHHAAIAAEPLLASEERRHVSAPLPAHDRDNRLQSSDGSRK